MVAAQRLEDHVLVAALGLDPARHDRPAARVVAVELEECDDARVPAHADVAGLEILEPRQIGPDLLGTRGARDALAAIGAAQRRRKLVLADRRGGAPPPPGRRRL